MNGERRTLSLVLRTGVAVSFVLLALGLILAAGNPAPEVLQPAVPGELVHGIAGGDSSSLIHAGLLVLMLTPFSRVLVMMVYFARRSEVPFLVVTIGVLFLLVGTVVARLF